MRRLNTRAAGERAGRPRSGCCRLCLAESLLVFRSRATLRGTCRPLRTHEQPERLQRPAPLCRQRPPRIPRVHLVPPARARTAVATGVDACRGTQRDCSGGTRPVSPVLGARARGRHRQREVPLRTRRASGPGRLRLARTIPSLPVRRARPRPSPNASQHRACLPLCSRAPPHPHKAGPRPPPSRRARTPPLSPRVAEPIWRRWRRCPLSRSTCRHARPRTRLTAPWAPGGASTHTHRAVPLTGPHALSLSLTRPQGNPTPNAQQSRPGIPPRAVAARANANRKLKQGKRANHRGKKEKGGGARV